MGMKKTVIIAGIIFATAFLLYGFITSSGFFPDPDSFYHIRMALLMRSTPVIHDFPWLSQTVFADSYVDHHWLYHLLLVPFVSLFEPVMGARLFTLLVAAAIPATIFLLVTTWGSRRVGLMAALLVMLSNPLGFRINLVKAPGLANLFILGFVALLAKKKYPWAGVLAAVYVWTYNGWLVFWVVAAAWCMALLVDAFLLHGIRHGVVLGLKESLRLIAWLLAGTVFGLVVNPYFPENVAFSWLHMVQIGIIGFKEQIGVGGEWYGMKPFALVAESALVVAGVAAGFVAMVVATGATSGRAWRDAVASPERVRALAFTFLTILFFVLTVRSRRHVEYLIPFAVLCGASLLLFARRVLPPGEARAMWDTIRSTHPAVRFPTLAFLIVLVPLIIFRDLRSLKHDFDVGIPPTIYSGAAAWLEQNAAAGDILWHSDWDDFPYFFLHTTRVSYIVGLDPAFMYVKNRDRYWQWVRLTQGDGEQQIAREISRDFNARYAFVDSTHTTLDQRLAQDAEATLMYRDRDGAIYRLP